MLEDNGVKRENKVLVKNWQCGPLGVNSYLVVSIENKEAVLIDSGDYEEQIVEFVKNEGLKPNLIIATHGHLDHIAGISEFKKRWNVPVACHERDIPFFNSPDPFLEMFLNDTYKPFIPEKILNDGDIISIGVHEMKVIHTPGHTPGSICLLLPPYLFSGDTLFQAGVGRTDLVGGDHKRLVDSLMKRLFPLPDELILFPGHGYSSRLGDEKERMRYY